MRPNLRFFPSRISAWFRRSSYSTPGWTMFRNSIGDAAGERPSKVECSRSDCQHLAAHALAGDAREVVAGIRHALPRRAEQHVDLRHGVRRQALEVRLPSRLAMAERLRPLPKRRVELLEEVERPAPAGEDVHLGMLRDDAAFVFDDVAGAAATLDGHVAQARVHGDVDAVEVLEDPPMLSVNVWKLSRMPNLPGFTSRNVSGYAAAAGQPGVARHVVDERVEVGRCQRAVDGGLEVPPRSA